MTLRWNKHPLLSLFSSHIIEYPTPINLNYIWSFGSAAGICLVIQIITGIFLAMYYTPHIDYAFLSIEFIMRNVNNGWIIRYLHANGASIFFIVVYCHILRGLYFGSYIQPRGLLWMSGVLLLILMMATAFIGYVLPWGQMSFWGVTVITNFFSAIPYVGKSIVEWLWGGFSIGNPTLNRFFSFHYLFPFLITGVGPLNLFFLFFSGKNKKSEFSQNDSKKFKKKGGPLTFKDRNFFFYHVKIPSFLSIKDCRHISIVLQKFDNVVSFIQFEYKPDSAKIILNFIEILEQEGILNEFIVFFTTKKKFNFKRFYIFVYTSPQFMGILSEALLIEFRNNSKITENFLKNLEKELPFDEEEKKELIGVLTDNISKVYDIFAFWLF